VLLEKALGNLGNGGRGIGNIVENLLIDPLSRYMFDNGIFSQADIEITAIRANEMPVSLECRSSHENKGSDPVRLGKE